MNLTKRTIDALKPPEKGYTLYWDSKLPGFGVRVTSSGMISFVLNYRVKGRERRYTIGRYGEITPTKAREEAMRIKSEVRGGTDPLADRAKGRNEPTFYNLADEY
ncbi:MAG: DUF4102 domain-containing protein, partial [Nitrospinaceae bacterium]|nr:DUF4102 domain-containing protein [Nitrospinaceae bacterium]